MPPVLDRFDHIHVHVPDRLAAEAWYRDVLGLSRVAPPAFRPADNGPLTLANPSGSIHLALFNGEARESRSTVALAVGADDFLAWRQHLSRVFNKPVRVVDHARSWSVYFADPDGNPFEITSYEYQAIADRLNPTH